MCVCVRACMRACAIARAREEKTDAVDEKQSRRATFLRIQKRRVSFIYMLGMVGWLIGLTDQLIIRLIL